MSNRKGAVGNLDVFDSVTESHYVFLPRETFLHIESALCMGTKELHFHSNIFKG